MENNISNRISAVLYLCRIQVVLYCTVLAGGKGFSIANADRLSHLTYIHVNSMQQEF